MLELNKEKGIVMYGCELNKEMEHDPFTGKSTQVLFLGTKSELLQKDEEFWKGIVKPHHKRGFFIDYAATEQDYQYFINPKWSGHSAVSFIKEENILIIKEKN